MVLKKAKAGRSVNLQAKKTKTANINFAVN